jgi:hypothetical protein
MKKILIAISIVLLGTTIYVKVENHRLKKFVVHQATMAQMDAITARARAFMEHHYNSDFVSGGASIGGMSYERTLNVPQDKKDEFTKWMAGYSLNAVNVEGYPSSSGSDLIGDDTKLVYRVYYGDEPEKWQKN